MYNECNKLHEYIDSIDIFADGDTAKAGRKARMAFTKTETKIKKKKSKEQNNKNKNKNNNNK